MFDTFENSYRTFHYILLLVVGETVVPRDDIASIIEIMDGFQEEAYYTGGYTRDIEKIPHNKDISILFISTVDDEV
jgi:hypothetical protein